MKLSCLDWIRHCEELLWYSCDTLDDTLVWLLLLNYLNESHSYPHHGFSSLDCLLSLLTTHPCPLDRQTHWHHLPYPVVSLTSHRPPALSISGTCGCSCSSSDMIYTGVLPGTLLIFLCSWFLPIWFAHRSRPAPIPVNSCRSITTGFVFMYPPANVNSVADSDTRQEPVQQGTTIKPAHPYSYWKRELYVSRTSVNFEH